MIFVSDEIPSSLRRIIEFLNNQMAQTEVLAIEVKQYTDAEGAHTTVVPRLIGETEASKQTKSRTRAGAPLDRDQLLAMLRGASADAETAGAALLDWAGGHPLIEVSWKRRTADVGVPRVPQILRIWNNGRLELRLRSLSDADPAWDDSRCDELIRRLEAIPDLRFEPGRNWPKASIAALADRENHSAFVTVIDDVVRQLKPPR